MLRAWSSPFLSRTGRYWLAAPLVQIDDGHKRLLSRRAHLVEQGLKTILFICSQNRWRSPTAEQVFAGYPGLEVASAGTNHDAENPLSAELVAWADMIVVMERQHRTKLQKRFRAALRGQRVICLDIPDNYTFMDPELLDLLKLRMARHMPTA
jgi:predicted protein tyrosine phosphatase